MQLMPCYGAQSRELNYCYALLQFLPALSLRGVVIPPPPLNELSCKAARALANAARPSVYTQQWCIHNKGSVLPWEEGGGGGKSAIAKQH
jgi:hypothetical protein